MRRAFAIAAAAAGVALLAPASGSTATRACGTKQLYGRTLTIRVEGRLLPCDRVRRIVRGRCRDGRVFSCFSFRAPGPLLVWFREKERYRRRWTTTITARRPPCSATTVTTEEWRRSRDGRGGFPTLQQVLADDLLRCHLLRGLKEAQVRELLGKPDYFSRDRARGERYLDWSVGPERDSFFQIDAEAFSVRVGRDGRVEGTSFYQQ